ncbi:MAG: hypothetical protein ACR2HV_00530 [Acidimicrobiales bacterium]
MTSPEGWEAEIDSGGTAASPEEVAAVMAALQIVLGREAPPEQVAPAWRWSGRKWQWPGDAVGPAAR